MLHLDTIAPDTLSLLKRIQALPEFSGTRLVGGTALALRSMSYFADAETMPMPRMLLPFEWEKAKARIGEAVRKLAMMKP